MIASPWHLIRMEMRSRMELAEVFEGVNSCYTDLHLALLGYFIA